MAAFTFPHDKLGRNSASFGTPLSSKFPRGALSRFGDLIISEVKILRSQTSDSNFLIAFQNVLRCLVPGSTIPGEQRHKPSLSCLRFVPSSTHILLSEDLFLENSCAVRWGASEVGWLSPF